MSKKGLKIAKSYLGEREIKQRIRIIMKGREVINI